MTSTNILSTDDLRQAIDSFYDGASSECLAAVYKVTRSAMGNRLSRAGVTRGLGGDPSKTFVHAESLMFRHAIAGGGTYADIAALMGKHVAVTRRHAEALGLISPDEAMANGGGPKPARNTPPPPRPPARVAKVAKPIEPIPARAALGGGVSLAVAEGAVSAAHDDAHVAACLAQGGFERYDFETGWTVGPDGDKRWPFSAAAIAEARAQVDAARGAPWTSTFLEAVEASEGRAA